MLPEVEAVVAIPHVTLTGDLPHLPETTTIDVVEVATVDDKTLVATPLDETTTETGTLEGMLPGMIIEGTSLEGTNTDETIDLLDETMTGTGHLLEELSEIDTMTDKIGAQTEVRDQSVVKTVDLSVDQSELSLTRTPPLQGESEVDLKEMLTEPQ